MALPTNYNVGPLGSESVSGVGGVPNYSRQGLALGALQTVHLVQGSDLGDAVTAGKVAQWKAPCAGFIREVSHSNYSVAATCTFDVNNETQAAVVIAAQTPSTNAAARVTTITTNLVAEGDTISVRVTTSGGSGACKGLNVWMLFIPTADSASNPSV